MSDEEGAFKLENLVIILVVLFRPLVPATMARNAGYQCFKSCFHCLKIFLVITVKFRSSLVVRKRVFMLLLVQLFLYPDLSNKKLQLMLKITNYC